MQENPLHGAYPPPDACMDDGMGDVGSCDEKAPPDAFDPVLEWSWSGLDGETQSVAIPLVANLTDDNDDGVLDPCDTPDVVVVAYAGDGKNPHEPKDNIAHIYVLDGATGQLHFRIDEDVSYQAHPAIGDIDGDGEPEIVTVRPFAQGRNLIAFESDGAMAWEGAATGDNDFSAVALADLDADGDVEIAFSGTVADHNGTEVFRTPVSGFYLAMPTAADLDGDGDMEVIFADAIHHHDGTLYYQGSGYGNARPQVADLDDDPEPEILLVAQGTPGLTRILEHDGTLKASLSFGFYGAAVHDLDGDERPELVINDWDKVGTFERDLTNIAYAEIDEQTGSSSASAFDFLGDGQAEVLFSDEHHVWAFDELGSPLFQVDRSSWTWTEFPIVADVDNDGSAEFLVTSNAGLENNQTSPLLQVFGDAEDRWIPARRIWNQHTYHVTNVNEDGTIPQHEPKHWKSLNTFRAQAQLNGQCSCDGSSICKPEPEG